MKTKFLLFTMLCCTLAWNAVRATEVEPNNTKAQANLLPLNGSNNGVIGTATDVDWYKVTTNGDGRIDVTLAVSNGIYCYFTVYDNDGSTVLNSTYTSGTQTYSVDGLATGTYYVEIYPYNAGQMPVYTISDALVKPTQANDAEPDSNRATALTLALNGSTTGHTGYYYNNHRDTLDEYSVTTNADGALNLTITSANNTYIYFALYDNDGKTLLHQDYTSTTLTYTVDGLAAGKYFIKVFCYNNDQFAPYTLSDSLTTISQANDAEPDSTRGTALTLPLNGHKTGHIGYYYNNHRDTLDEYKVTTNADGALNLTLASANGTYVYFALYDNDGATLLKQDYTSGTETYTQDGLAAGTYYVKIFCYNNYQFAPYTLSNTLSVPSQPNDSEPDSTKQTALTLPLNGTVTGHIGYYYNNHRDTLDEYKLTTTADGDINLNFTSANNTYVYFALYDHDGVTLIHQDYTSGNENYNVDGLAAGTYYIKIFCYNNYQFAPYILQNTLYTYSKNDREPDDFAGQAMTLPANDTTTGHVGFYYNNARDTTDWFKINYTGTGNLSVNLTLQSHITGGTDYTYFQIYKDTTASPLFSDYTSGSETANLTGLSEGYYYVKIFEYNNFQFTSYSVTPTFTQVDKAKISLTSADSTANCDSTSSIIFKCKNSHSPYSVQLYDFGVKYGKAINVGSSGKAEFDSLPAGSYYAIVYGDGATGKAYSTSDIVTIALPQPTALTVTNIQSTQVKLNWSPTSCATSDTIEYRVEGTAKWSYAAVSNNGFYILKGLTPSTTYVWGVEAVKTSGSVSVKSGFALGSPFTTTAAANNELFAGKEINPSATVVSVYPNPATSQIHIVLGNTEKALVVLKDMNGKTMWSTESAGNTTLSTDVSRLPAGIYFLQIFNADKSVTIHKIVVAK